MMENQNKNLYKIYVATKKKDGTVLKSDAFLTTADSKDIAIENIIRDAKYLYGFKGKVRIQLVLIRNEQKKYVKI